MRAQLSQQQPSVVVAAALDLAATPAGGHTHLARSPRAVPVIDVRSADHTVAASARPPQLIGSVFGAFAVSALVLAAIGLFGCRSALPRPASEELGVRAAMARGRAV